MYNTISNQKESVKESIMNSQVYYMFNKPKGCVTARKDDTHKTVMDYFPENEVENIHPVGRLDKDTEGFLIVTSDGKFNQRLMHPEFHVPKTYYFHALGELDTEDVKKLNEGIILLGEDKLTNPAEVKVEKTGSISEVYDLIKGTKFERAGRNPRNTEIVSGWITITEGKKHQVKRMLKAVGCYVVYLKRTAIGGVSIDKSLKTGEYRELTPEEIIILSC